MSPARRRHRRQNSTVPRTAPHENASMQNGPTHHTPRPACDATSSSIVSSQARALVSRQHAHSRAVMGTAMPRQHAHSRAVMGTSNAELLPALTTALLPVLTTALLPALTTALTPWRPLPYLSPPWPPPPPPPWRPRPQRLWPWRQLTRGHPHRRRHRDSIPDRDRDRDRDSIPDPPVPQRLNPRSRSRSRSRLNPRSSRPTAATLQCARGTSRTVGTRC